MFKPTKNNFKKDFNIGLIGENIVKKYFENKGYKSTHASVKEELQFGYDFIVEKEEERFKIEVKTELKAITTSNIFFELIANNKPGWTQKYNENSDVFIYWVLPHLEEIWVLPASRLKTLEQKAKEENFKIVTIKTGCASGICIPLSFLKNWCNVLDISTIIARNELPANRPTSQKVGNVSID